MKTDEILEIDPKKVKVFIHRDRTQPEFEGVRDAIQQDGQILPGQVRDITGWPAEKRKMPDGTLADYGLVTGEGRLRAALETKRKFEATLVNESNLAIVGLFLAENLIRRPLPWAQRAKLMAVDHDAGMSVPELAKTYNVNEAYVKNLLSISSRIAEPISKHVSRLPIRDARALVALPPDAQMIVMAEVQGDAREVAVMVRHAQRLVEKTGAPLNGAALKASLSRVLDDLKLLRENLKLARLHHALGPDNIRSIMASKKLAALCKANSIDLSRFK